MREDVQGTRGWQLPEMQTSSSAQLLACRQLVGTTPASSP
jgi:hypothetical protein